MISKIKYKLNIKYDITFLFWRHSQKLKNPAIKNVLQVDKKVNYFVKLFGYWYTGIKL